jgi:DNA integrity scanning protein DisA with diadenylate cyclase activity
MTTNPDGSEDVNDFLSRIRELGERHDKENEERTKKLEEEILQGRKERQARRAGTIFPVLQFSLAVADLVDINIHIDGALARSALTAAGPPRAAMNWWTPHMTPMMLMSW